MKLFRIVLFLIIFSMTAVFAADAPYSRIVVLSDVHLPTKTRSTPKILDAERVIKAKKDVIHDINGWSDVTRVAVTGDIVANYAADDELSFAADFFKLCVKPLLIVNGNHDYFYVADPDNIKKNMRGTPETRKKKLSEFAAAFNLRNLDYTEKISNVLLVFLSVDELEGKYAVRVSKSGLDWLSRTLSENRKTPVIVFCHAPLDGTIHPKNERDPGSSFVEPKPGIEKIIMENPQVFMWVSGHTHTPPKNPDFCDPVNLYKGRVMNIHNTDMDRYTIYTNSLYIYNDRVEVKTFNHGKKEFEKKFDRTIRIPVLSR